MTGWTAICELCGRELATATPQTGYCFNIICTQLRVPMPPPGQLPPGRRKWTRQRPRHKPEPVVMPDIPARLSVANELYTRLRQMRFREAMAWHKQTRCAPERFIIQ